MSNRRVLAVGAHPDDIELMIAGTLILLTDAGWEPHYLNIANGSCGSTTLEPDQIIAVRLEEAKRAASFIGAHFYPPYVPDIEIFYERGLLAKLGALVRTIQPQILLLQSPQDYMEDHMNAVRLMVTAAFCRGIRNYPTDPPTPVTNQDMAVYHALPWGLTDPLRNPITPDFFVDITTVMDRKKEMLSCHESQRSWLDASQGHDNYIQTMVQMSAEVGEMSGAFQYAEGWRRHQHVGFGPEDDDPLKDTLSGLICEP